MIKRKLFSFFLPEKMLFELRNLSISTDITVSEIIRSAIADYLKKM